MAPITVRLGFVPTFRFRNTAWTEKMRADSLAAFARVPGLEVIAPAVGPAGSAPDPLTGSTPFGMLNNLDQAEAVADYFQACKVDGLIVCPLDFGDERSAVKVAERLKVPVLLYATKEPPAPSDSGLSRVSDSYCGNLSMASGLYRRKIAFHYAGLFFPDEPELLAEVTNFTRAVAVVKGLRGARIGQIGVRPASFETVAYDEVAMIQKFGQNVIHTELSDLTEKALALPDDDPRVAARAAEIRASAPAITVSDNYVSSAAKFELVLADFWQRNHLSAMAVQCWPSIQRLMNLSVCASYGRMTGQDMLTACETDVLGALSMLVSYQAGLGDSLPHFVDWTIQHRQNANQLLAWHCGNAPVALARDPAEVALRSRENMTGDLPPDEGDSQAGLYQFQVRPGTVTFCRLAEYDNHWKMLIAAGQIVPSDETLAGTWSWVEVRDHASLYRTLVEEGFIHHASLIHGDQTAALRLACKFLDITPVVVI
jgi:L-fucose isomerase-like protein